MISPAEFIPVAEETGLICQIGDWVLDTACAEATHWPPGIKLAVNVSPVQFRSHAFSLKVANALATSGLSANRLELEITEAVLIRDDEAALTMLQHLRAIGRKRLASFLGFKKRTRVPLFLLAKIDGSPFARATARFMRNGKTPARSVRITGNTCSATNDRNQT